MGCVGCAQGFANVGDGVSCFNLRNLGDDRGELRAGFGVLLHVGAQGGERAAKVCPAGTGLMSSSVSVLCGRDLVVYVP